MSRSPSSTPRSAAYAVQAIAAAGLGLLQAAVPLGSCTLLLVGPGPDETAPSNQALRRRLGTSGEGLLGITLRTSGGGMRSLPATLTHGMPIDLAAG